LQSDVAKRFEKKIYLPLKLYKMKFAPGLMSR